MSYYDESLVPTYRYGPYGSLVSQSGYAADDNTRRFSSKELETLTGQYYYGYRFYDPYPQRWLNRDPLGESGFQLLRLRNPSQYSINFTQHQLPNRYAFVHSNPVSLKDSWGLKLTLKDCKKHRRDCIDDIWGIATGNVPNTGVGIGITGCGFAVAKWFNKAAGVVVGGVGTIWGAINVGRTIDIHYNRNKQCGELYSKCRDAVIRN